MASEIYADAVGNDHNADVLLIDMPPTGSGYATLDNPQSIVMAMLESLEELQNAFV
jgi:hypothetical protein